MFSVLGGVAAIAVSLLLLWAFRPRQGRAVVRSEWFEVSLAILITTGISIGAMAVVAGLVQSSDARSSAAVPAAATKK
jgi:hypothetical protein